MVSNEELLEKALEAHGEIQAVLLRDGHMIWFADSEFMRIAVGPRFCAQVDTLDGVIRERDELRAELRRLRDSMPVFLLELAQ